MCVGGGVPSADTRGGTLSVVPNRPSPWVGHVHPEPSLNLLSKSNNPRTVSHHPLLSGDSNLLPVS